MTNILNVTVADGKYTYVMRADGSTTALRYGEAWPAFENQSPDNLHFALASEVQELRDEQRQVLTAIIERADNGELGSSKVQDMRRLAVEMLAKHGVAT
jgi:hypothetical protein